MSKPEYMHRYENWLQNPGIAEPFKQELRAIADDPDEIQDRFYQDLAFGTAGLRGILGAGTNRMNTYIVGRATRGLAEVICEEGQQAKDAGVVIAYDCRHRSEEFANKAALVLAAAGVKTYLFDSLRPTPELSFAVRHLKATAGIVVTASHNPKNYNGYKVYWKEGSQILEGIASRITEKIQAISDPTSVPVLREREALEKGLLVMIGEKIDELYINSVLNLALSDDLDHQLRIVYTPLNGTGNIPVRTVLKKRGFENVFVVPEQEKPDPDFTTIEYPNPEDLRAFEYAIRLGKEKHADLLIATDPDCDRLAVMVKDSNGAYQPLNGNQTGALLIAYILSRRSEMDQIPDNAVIVKSIVTGDLGKAIAQGYGVETKDALTGFKNICGLANEYEQSGEHTFLFGYEESIGYVYGTEVRDKDAVNAAMMLSEAAAFYKKRGKTLLDVLQELFHEHGFFGEAPFSLVLEGWEGQQRIARMMEFFRRTQPLEILAGEKRTRVIDFLHQKTIPVPPTNGLKFEYSDGSWFALRPSGTEPKLKVYLYTVSPSLSQTQKKLKQMDQGIRDALEAVE